MLQVREVAVARGGVTVLEGVNFHLRSGEALVLRGPNGLGKTTLLRSLAGLQPLRAGACLAAPDSLAYASHADGLKATLSVRENLNFWASVFGADAGAMPQALAAMDLETLIDRPAQNLSAGQKRRLGLARLLLTGRPVWLLDEPTVSLDAHSVGLFAAMIRRHLASGGAAVLATHIDLGLEAARVLDLTPYRARPSASGGSGDAFDEAFL